MSKLSLPLRRFLYLAAAVAYAVLFFGASPRGERPDRERALPTTVSVGMHVARAFSPMLFTLLVLSLGGVVWWLTGVSSEGIMLPTGVVHFTDYKTSSLDAGFVAADYRARVSWGIAGFFAILASAIAIIVGCVAIKRAARGRPWRVGAFAFLFVSLTLIGKTMAPPFPRACGLGVLFAVSSGQRFYPVIDEALRNTLASPNYFIGPIAVLDLQNWLGWPAILASTSMILGFCAILFYALDRRQPASENELRWAIDQSRRLLFVSAAVLVSGVSALTALYLWPLVFVAGTPGSAQAVANAEAIKEVAIVMSLSTGSLYSLFLLTSFFPAAYYLDRAVRELATAGGVLPTGLEEWLQEHSLTLSPMTELKPILAVLSPLVAGGSASALINLFTSGGS